MSADLNHERRFRVAVWCVIASEALLFSGLFALYVSYRTEYPRMFSAGVRDDIQWIGGLNTMLLLTSSFAIAWAIHRERMGKRRRPGLAAVILLGLGFLVFKALEWGEHIQHHVVPGKSLFVTLYYFMTGLHALHVIAGLALVTWVTVRRTSLLALELVALYWHFVDVVWVFLWPMFYLMR